MDQRVDEKIISINEIDKEYQKRFFYKRVENNRTSSINKICYSSLGFTQYIEKSKRISESLFQYKKSMYNFFMRIAEILYYDIINLNYMFNFVIYNEVKEAYSPFAEGGE